MNMVKVAKAVVCSHCESIVGKEEVVSVKESVAQEKAKTDPEVYFAYEDKRLGTSYRSLSSVSNCRQC